MADDRNRRTATGTFPAVPTGAGQPGRTSTGTFPAVPTGAGARPSSTGTFSAVPTSPGARSPTGTFPVMPAGGQAARPFVPTAGNPQRDPRAGVVVPVRYRFESIVDFVETQSMNISRTGMFVVTDDPQSVGTVMEFEYVLADGFAILKGRAEVVRVSQAPAGVGMKFLEVDETSRKLIERIVDVNTREGKKPTVSLEFSDTSSVAALRSLAGATPVSSGVVFNGRDLQVQITPATVGYFVYNPLLNLRLGGFVVPAEEDVSLGTLFSVALSDMAGTTLWAGKGKVVAKHELRLGIRLLEVDKATLARLQGEVNKLAPTK